MNAELPRHHIIQQKRSIIRQIIPDLQWICNNIRKFQRHFPRLSQSPFPVSAGLVVSGEMTYVACFCSLREHPSCLWLQERNTKFLLCIWLFYENLHVEQS